MLSSEADLVTRLMIKYVLEGKGLASTIRSEAESCQREALRSYGQSPGESNTKAYAILLLSVRLKHWIVALNPLRTDQTIYGIVMDACLNEVDWDRVAETILDNLPIKETQ